MSGFLGGLQQTKQITVGGKDDSRNVFVGELFGLEQLHHRYEDMHAVKTICNLKLGGIVSVSSNHRF